MMKETLEKWHDHLRGRYAPGLDGLLHEDCVFYSPVVFTPQRGRELTKMYLTAAGATLGDTSDAASKDAKPKGDSIPFRYIKEVVAGNTAVLEFERTMGGKYVNGVDIITCDDNGLIIEFKVMIRPLQAVNHLHQQMAAMLKKMEGA
jgi:hypothetical protein